MKNLLLIAFGCLWLSPQLLFAQDTSETLKKENHPVSRQGQLYFSVGTEYRTGLIENPNRDTYRITRGIDIGDLNRGTAFNYSLDYFITHDLSIGFSHSLRYDHILQASRDAIPGGLESKAAISDTYGLLMDYHFFAKHHFRLKKHEFFFQVGVSVLHNAPNITKNPVSIFNNGVERIDETNVDLMEISYKMGLGYQKNRFSVMGGHIFVVEY